MRKNEVDVFEAQDMDDIRANVLCRLAAEGKLKSRRAPAAVIGRIQQRAALLDRFMEILINPSYPLQLAGVGSPVEAPPRAWFGPWALWSTLASPGAWLAGGGERCAHKEDGLSLLFRLGPNRPVPGTRVTATAQYDQRLKFRSGLYFSSSILKRET
jgi:hypothetical protein